MSTSSSHSDSPGPSSDTSDDFSGPSRVNVLYASVTGTSQDAAEGIGRAIRRRRWPCRVCDVADLGTDISPVLGPDPLILLVSTTGNGAFPPSLLPLWRFLLRADLPNDLASDLPFAIFGLGDTSYPKFCWPAKKLDRRLVQLGGIPFIQRGEGDEQDYLGIDTTLSPWVESLWAALKALYPLPPDLEPLPEGTLPPPRLRLVPAPPGYVPKIEKLSKSSPSSMPQALSDPEFVATISANNRVTSTDHFQDTRVIDFEFEKPAEYLPGDVLGLRPSNSPEDVERLIRLLKWENHADRLFYFQAASDDEPLPSHFPKENHPTSLRNLLTHHLDCFAVPRRSFFEWLSHFTQDSEDEQEKCQEFSSAEGQEDFYDYATRPRRTMYEALTEFKSAKIPIEYAADIFPQLRKRQFSIASSCQENNKLAKLLVAIVKYKTIIKAARKGVCTSWLSTLPVGSKVAVTIEDGAMRPPESPKVPIILIGPGTGIAPFRSFVRERILSGGKENMVFFGCRSKDKDFYFQQEWNDLLKEGGIDLNVAASRDQENKVYVQHLLRTEGKKVWDYIQRGAWIFISGSAGNMPKAIRRALVEIAMELAWVQDDRPSKPLDKEKEDIHVDDRRRMSKKEADDWLESLENSGRLQEETWN